ncbi:MULTISPECIES: helix-turn-helix and ligand-binding sensor domain-containing protein [Robiginitalea]|nr:MULTISPECIES: Two component regulator three Y domain-containing protein [Robiginitalea]MDC6373727.1 Two component regulator three Y domain-containing protein [Robiginitalea sp. SP8]
MLILLGCMARGQQLRPSIRNYGVNDYQTASKNWGLDTDSNGELYAANNKGLLHFNGEHWELYRLPNNTVIRSVACVGNRVYTGSYEEFGYWEKNRMGILEYTSLTNLIRDHTFTSEEFWQILPVDGDVWFRSFSSIYRYDGRAIQVLNPPFVVTALTHWNGDLWMAGGHRAIYQIHENTWELVLDDPALQDRVIADLAPFGESMLIGTKLHGCYRFDGTRLTPLPETINGPLREFQLNQIYPLSDGKIAFGTIKNGVYLYDRKSDQLEVFSRQEGMQNNTVHAFAQFADQLWVGLDNGIDRFHLNNYLTFYTDYSGVAGTSYDMAFRDSTLYLGTNTGVYYFEGSALSFVPGSQGHVWDLQDVGDVLLCGHNTGTFLVGKNSFQPVSDYAGGYVMARIPESEDEYMQGTYVGLAKFRQGPDAAWKVDYLEGLQEPIKYLAFEDEHTLWAAHSYRGVYRIVLNENRDSLQTVRRFTGEELPNIYNVRLYRIKNQIILQSNGNWFRYDPILDRLTNFEDFEAFSNSELLYFDDERYWFVGNTGSRVITITDLKEFQVILDDQELRRRLTAESDRIIKRNDSLYYITLRDGFARLNFNAFVGKSRDMDLPVPDFYRIADAQALHPLDSNLTFTNRMGREIEVAVAAPSMPQARYQYELKGPVRQSGITDNGTLVFQNLPYGRYELGVRTIRIGNQRSEAAILEFYVEPPWYLSTWSLILYAMMGVGLIFAVRVYNQRKYNRKRRKLEQELQREQAVHLARLEKEKMSREIKLKQKELARSTMDLARNNEMILELKNMLMANKESFGNRPGYRKVIKKLNNSINNKEDWKRFEVSFKELHEDFFENLLEQFPDLTPKDLRLCAYLKMNLASKEIAPLMGISVRGVEIHRYRLRKKLRLDSSQNMSNYLIKFK